MREEQIEELTALIRAALELADQLEMQTIGIRLAETLDFLTDSEEGAGSAKPSDASQSVPPRLKIC